MTIVTDVERVAGAEDAAIPVADRRLNLHVESCADGFERAFEMFEFHYGIIESSSVLSARERVRWTDVTAIFQTRSRQREDALARWVGVSWVFESGWRLERRRTKG